MAKPKWATDKLKKMEESGGGGGDFYNFKDGANVLRILPSWKGEDEQFYVEDAIHYKIGPDKARVKCRKLIGKACAVCEAADKAFKSGDKDTGREFKAKSRYYTNAIDLTAPKSGVQCAAFGPQVLKQILTYLVDEDDEWGEWWHAKGRYDFKIVKKGDGMETEYTVFPTRKFVDVKTDAKPKDLEALGSKVPSYEEQQSILSGEEVEEEPEEDAEEEIEAASEVDEDEEVEKRHAKKSKKPAAEEDEEEVAEEPEEEAEEDAEEEEEAPKKKSKKVVEEEDEPAEEESEEEAPACFQDPGQHDPEDEICTDCSFFAACGKAVLKKIKAEPKKYKAAPLALAQVEEEDDEEVEEELKKSVAKGKVKKSGSRK